MLLEANANPNAADKPMDETPLMEAARNATVWKRYMSKENETMIPSNRRSQVIEYRHLHCNFQSQIGYTAIEDLVDQYREEKNQGKASFHKALEKEACTFLPNLRLLDLGILP